MNRKLVITILLFMNVLCFCMGDTNKAYVVINNEPVALDITIGADTSVGMMTGTGINLYYTADWAITDFMNLNLSHHLLNPLAILILSDPSSVNPDTTILMKDYFLNSCFRGGVEIPLTTWITEIWHEGHLIDREGLFGRADLYSLEETIPYQESFALRAGYTHSLGGPDFMTRVEFDPFAGTQKAGLQKYEIWYNKNWHGVYAGISIISKGGLEIEWTKNYKTVNEIQGNTLKHSLDIHYYFIDDMITEGSENYIESSLPLAVEYTFSFHNYGNTGFNFFGSRSFFPVSFDITVGYGPFFEAPKGISYEENNLIPFYCSFAMGIPLAF